MRIRKAPKSGSQVVKSHTPLTEHERLLWKDIDELILSSDKEALRKLLVQHVMKPLLGPQYVDAGVWLHYYFLISLLFISITFFLL